MEIVHQRIGLCRLPGHGPDGPLEDVALAVLHQQRPS
jgi:hypothetical protein